MAGHKGPAKRGIRAGDVRSATDTPRVTVGFGASRVSTPVRVQRDMQTFHRSCPSDNMGISLGAVFCSLWPVADKEMAGVEPAIITVIRAGGANAGMRFAADGTVFAANCANHIGMTFE